MNRTLLLKVKEQILKEPERFIMETWVASGRFTDYGLRHDFCGTAACIGGWCCLVAQQDKKHKIPFHIDDAINRGDYGTAAACLLGLGGVEAGKLFAVTNWPEDLRQRWNHANIVERAEIAAEVIDRFIEARCGSNKAA